MEIKESDCYINFIEYYLPDNLLTNEDISKRFPSYNAEKISQKIGIECRHISDTNQTASDLAIEAAKKLLSQFPYLKRDIDYVLFCSQSPDYFLPTTACLIQNKLELNNSIGAIDINQGCSGYVYALSLAKGLVCGSIAKCVLILTGDTYTKYIHEKDFKNQTIFGDGGSASIVSATPGKFGKLGEFSFFTNGIGYNSLIVENGGSRNRNSKTNSQVSFDAENNLISADHLYMNGKKVFEFTANEIPKNINELLKKSNFNIADIDLFVPHQANSYMLNFVRKLLGIEKEKFLVDLALEGNTVSSTIPIVLKKNQQRISSSENIILSGFGVGLSIASVIIRNKQL